MIAPNTAPLQIFREKNLNLRLLFLKQVGIGKAKFSLGASVELKGEKRKNRMERV